MPGRDFYDDLKYCEHCQRYVSYLLGIGKSYCVECGGPARLFSPSDRAAFHANLSAKPAVRREVWLKGTLIGPREDVFVEEMSK